MLNNFILGRLKEHLKNCGLADACKTLQFQNENSATEICKRATALQTALCAALDIS